MIYELTQFYCQVHKVSDVTIPTLQAMKLRNREVNKPTKVRQIVMVAQGLNSVQLQRLHSSRPHNLE